MTTTLLRLKSYFSVIGCFLSRLKTFRISRDNQAEPDLNTPFIHPWFQVLMAFDRASRAITSSLCLNSGSLI